MRGIRRATVSDLGELLALLKALHAESVFHDIAVEHDRLQQFVTGFISDPKNICIVYENAAAGLDGMLLGFVKPYYFSGELSAWDLAFYVRPGRRGSMVAFRLWREFKARATELRARVLWLGSTGIAPRSARRFYTGLGMVEVGALYRLALPSQSD
jgi:hypothetical protein